MKLLKKLSMVLALGIGTSLSVQAATLGLQTPSVGYATWDTWTVSANSPINTNSPLFSSTLTPSAAATSGGNERTYDFGSAFTFTINATATSFISSVTFQIRATMGNDNISGMGGPAFLTSGNLKLNGATATSFASIAAGDSLAGGPTPTPFYIYSWTWNSLNIANGQTFSLGFIPSGSFHTSYDAFRISAVPEPATAGLLIIGAGLAFLAKRRRA